MKAATVLPPKRVRLSFIIRPVKENTLSSQACDAGIERILEATILSFGKSVECLQNVKTSEPEISDINEDIVFQF